MDPFLWAYGLMARETGTEDGPRDPERLTRYRDALDLSLVETESLAQAQWDEGQVPACPPRVRLDILRALARAARSLPGGWTQERQRLVRLGERFEIPPIECANILVEAGDPAAARPTRRSPSRRTLLRAAGGVAGALVLGAVGVRYLGGADRSRFAGFEHAFADALLLIEVECDLILGTGRVPYRSLGMGFFVDPDGLLVTNKNVIQPWKFVPELVRKLDAGYLLDEESVQVRAWRMDELRMAERGRFDVSSAFQTGKETLAIEQVTPDSMTSRSVAQPEGGVHRGMYHVLDRSNIALLRARVPEPVHAIELAPASIAAGDRIVALGVDLPRRSARERGVQVRSALGRVHPGRGGTLKLSASVPPQCSGGPVLDVEGRAVGVATQRLGDSEGARCVPAEAVRDLVQLTR